jgi:hypothetical protein
MFTMPMLSMSAEEKTFMSSTVGFFLSFRYVIRNVESVKLIDETGPFELYRKLFQKIRDIWRTSEGEVSH